MSKHKSGWFSRFSKSIQKGEGQSYNYRLFDELSLLAKNRFKWSNLPDGIESRYIERYLFETGQVSFFKDSENGMLSLPCSPANSLNVYGEPMSFNVYGVNYSKIVDTDDMVRILCNDNATPNILKVQYYAFLIDEIEKTMYMNLKQQRYPWIIGASKETELSIKKLLDKIDDFTPAILTDRRITDGGDLSFKSLNTETPYILDKLRAEKMEVVNELLSWLGLNNTQNNKRERMLVDEINVNNNQILMNLDIEYKNRQKACEEINKKFGLNITVEKTIDELSVDFLGSQIEDRKEDEKRGWFK